MSTKHTPTPWTFNDYEEDFGDITAKGRKQAIAEICDRAGQSYTNKDRANGRLIVASVNSYAKHCKDPVAATESDLLGRLIEAYREEADEHCFYADGCPAFGTRHGMCRSCRARALLAETKEGA